MNDPSWPAVVQLAIQVVMSLGLAWIGYLTLLAKAQSERNNDAINTVGDAINGRVEQMVKTANAAGHARGVTQGMHQEATRTREMAESTGALEDAYKRGLMAGAELEAAAAAERAAAAQQALGHATGTPEYLSGMRAAETLASTRTAAVLNALRGSSPLLASKSCDEVAATIAKLSAWPPDAPDGHEAAASPLGSPA